MSKFILFNSCSVNKGLSSIVSRGYKRGLRFLGMLVIFILYVNCSRGEIIWTNPITGTNPNTSNPYTVGDTKNINISVSGIGRGTGIIGDNASDRYSASGWNVVLFDENKFFSFTMTPNSGFKINLTNLVYTGLASPSGAKNVSIRSSLDSYTTNIGTATVSGNTIDLTNSIFQNLISSITFRIYGWGATNVNGTYSINDFTFNGTVLDVTTTPQTITFNSLTPVTYGDAPFVVSATGGASGNPVTFTSSDPTVATCTGTNGTTVSILKAGSCTINANQAGNAAYNAATQVGQTLTVNPKELTLANATVTNKIYNGNNSAVITGTLTGIINSDNVTFNGTGTFADVNVAEGITVSSTSTLSGTNAGNYTLTQPSGLTGNITKANQTISLSMMAAKYVGDPDYTLAATSATSGVNALSYSSSNTSAASINATTGLVHIGVPGIAILTVSQPGNANYNAANNVTQSLIVSIPPVIIAGWDFTGVGLTSLTTYSATTINGLVTIAGASDITRGANAAWSDGSNSFRTVGFKNEGISTSSTDYFQVTLQPETGKKISLSSINANLAGTATFCVSPGVQSQFAYSLDCTNFTLINSPQTIFETPQSLSTINLTGISALQNITNGSTIYLRYYASGQTTTGGWGFYSETAGTNGLAISGLVVNIYNIVATTNDALKGSVSGMGTKDAGATVSLSATPTSGSYRFVNWTESGTGNFVSVDNPYSFTASADKTLIANFADFTTTITSQTNASTIADCPTCDVTVSNMGKLTINAHKTFNSVTVAPGGKLTLANGKTLTAPVTLQSTVLGTGTFVDENIADVPTPVTGTVEQYLTTGRNWYVSIPVTAGTTAALSTATSVQYWNELIGDWATLSSGAALDPSRGYISVATNQTQAITFNGTLNSGKKEIVLTRTTGKTKEGFNLVGNPYPSYLNWTADIATAANVIPSIWYRTKPGSSYAFYTYNADGVVGVPTNALGVIPPMQAFWVRSNAGGGTLTFNNTMRTHGSGSNLLKAPAVAQPILRLQVTGSLNTDEAVVYFNSKASNGYDSYDSPKMAGSNTASEIYTLAGNEELVINGMKNYSLDSEIPLGFRPGKGSGLSIKASEFSNFDSNIHVFLKDAKNNNEVEITNTEYPISDATASTNRFSIIFKTVSKTTNLDNNTNQQIVISKNANNQITVNCAGNQSFENSITVHNAIGQKLITKKLLSTSTVLDIPNGSGVYLVTVINAGNKITRKVILN